MGRRRFTMSPIVATLHRDGALLPMWYASPGDCVLASSPGDEWISMHAGEFGIDVRPVDFCAGADGAPWGWSHDSARRLSLAGALTPPPDTIDRLARLSHRRLSVEVMRRLKEELPFAIPPLPVEVSAVSEFVDVVDNEGSVYVKSPWSSSGRGVFKVDRVDETVLARVNGMIRKQGSVMVEKSLDKKRDFAMLFKCEAGKASFGGYSVFFNSVGDAYGGNILAPDALLEEMIAGEGVSVGDLRLIAAALERALTDIVASVHEGWLGVDMLVCHDGMIAPCVEVNLRMTMGVVARVLYDRYIDPGMTGVYRVTRGSAALSKPRVVAGKLNEGGVFLTPPSVDGFNFTMEIVTC